MLKFYTHFSPYVMCVYKRFVITFKDEAQTALFKDPVRTAL